MRYPKDRSDYEIRGSCSLFVCRLCRTKFGWEHQEWCDNYSLTEPACRDCRYNSARSGKCLHPIKKLRGRRPKDEEDQGSL